MTLTPCNSPQPCCPELFRNPHDACSSAPQGCSVSRDMLTSSSHEYAVEAQRMRAFAGQTKFQAPVADDFSRGMFADGQNPGGNVMKHRGLINGLTAWWRKQTLD